MTGEGKGKWENLAAGALLPYKLKVGKRIILYSEKENRGKSNYCSCSKLVQKEQLLLLSLRAVNTRAPPGNIAME